MQDTIGTPGAVVWFTGPAASGKSTLAQAVAGVLQQRHVTHEIIDGDEVRAFFEDDLGYSREDRVRNIRRIAFVAGLLERHGIVTLVSNIAPYEDARQWIRARMKRFCLVHMATPIEVCRQRDGKGVYASASPVIGRDEPYETPGDAEVTILPTETATSAAERVIEYLAAKRWITT